MVFDRQAAATASGAICAALLPLQPGQNSFVALITAHQLCTAWISAIMHRPTSLEIRQVPHALGSTLQHLFADGLLCECR